MNIAINKSDRIGIMASSVCLIHCLATPFLFLAKLGADGHGAAPFWWSILDYLFLGVALFAVFHSAKMSTKVWVKAAMWLSWLGLFVVIMNEKIHMIHLAESAIYFPALSLILLHFYNLKYCRCDTNECAASQ